MKNFEEQRKMKQGKRGMLTRFLIALFCSIQMLFAVNGYGQQTVTVSGTVTDAQGQPLPGVTITIVGTTRGVITDNDGTYSIEVKSSDKLAFSFVGMESQIIDIDNRTNINVEMKEKIDELEEVTVVAFGKQKKESVISSISTVNTTELKVPSSNLSTSLAGRVAGLISYQRTGEPGEDDASFFIRGVPKEYTIVVNLF